LDKEVFACAVSCLLFFLAALIFTALKGKAAILISGFNTLPKQERALYDQERMSQDQRNAFFLWSVIMGIGALLSYFVSKYMAIAAFGVWFLVFLKDVHLDEEKAFGKYRKSTS
jgi:hypothetical protein